MSHHSHSPGSVFRLWYIVTTLFIFGDYYPIVATQTSSSLSSSSLSPRPLKPSFVKKDPESSSSTSSISRSFSRTNDNVDDDNDGIADHIGDSNKLSLSDEDYNVLSDKVVYKRWRSVIQRIVRLPNGKVVDFDIIDQKGAGAVVIVAWNSRTKTMTLLREYHPAPRRVLYGPAAGIIESDAEKHDSDPARAARCELEEECHLRGGTWYPLNRVGLPMDKYSVTEIMVYLVVDAEVVDDPAARDDEEHIEIVSGLSVERVKRLIVEGEMNLVGVSGCLMAMEKLRELGEI